MNYFGTPSNKSFLPKSGTNERTTDLDILYGELQDALESVLYKCSMNYQVELSRILQARKDDLVQWFEEELESYE